MKICNWKSISKLKYIQANLNIGEARCKIDLYGLQINCVQKNNTLLHLVRSNRLHPGRDLVGTYLPYCARVACTSSNQKFTRSSYSYFIILIFGS